MAVALPGLLMCWAGAASSAEFTATPSGNFPLLIAAGGSETNIFAVSLDANGMFPTAQSGSINVCDEVTLTSTGEECIHTKEIPISPGKPPANFPQDVHVTVHVAPDVPCGQVYKATVDTWLDVTGGADFGTVNGVTTKSATVEFTVQVLCTNAGEGCGLGYWKNHTDSWSGSDPDDSVSSLFASTPSTLEKNTLLEALAFPGGSSLEEAIQILLRQAVAAALNAEHSSVNYPRELDEIQDDVNTAIDSGIRSNILELSAALDGDNNLGCPLE